MGRPFALWRPRLPTRHVNTRHRLVQEEKCIPTVIFVRLPSLVGQCFRPWEEVPSNQVARCASEALARQGPSRQYLARQGRHHFLRPPCPAAPPSPPPRAPLPRCTRAVPAVNVPCVWSTAFGPSVLKVTLRMISSGNPRWLLFLHLQHSHDTFPCPPHNPPTQHTATHTTGSKQDKQASMRICSTFGTWAFREKGKDKGENEATTPPHPIPSLSASHTHLHHALRLTHPPLPTTGTFLYIGSVVLATYSLLTLGTYLYPLSLPPHATPYAPPTHPPIHSLNTQIQPGPPPASLP